MQKQSVSIKDDPLKMMKDLERMMQNANKIMDKNINYNYVQPQKAQAKPNNVTNPYSEDENNTPSSEGTPNKMLKDKKALFGEPERIKSKVPKTE